MKKRSIVFLFLALSVLAVAAQEGDYGAGDKRILIAFEPTRFKKALVEEMIALLNDGSATLKVVNHMKKGLEGQDASDFDVVFITNSGATAKVRPDVSRWVEANGHPDNVIVHTTQRTRWTPQLQVDSVTSASLKKGRETEALAVDFVQRIRDRLP